MMKTFQDIDTYIADQPKSTQVLLEKIRQTIKKAAPQAAEAISYGIPTFKLNGNLVHFGGYQHHIGFYPGSEAITVFKKELSEYEVSKGTAKFSLDKPIPYDLIKKITEYRAQQMISK